MLRKWMFAIISLLTLCGSVFGQSARNEETYAFREIWAYLFKGEEKHLTGTEPITDLAYFSAILNETGRIDKVPDITALPEKIRTKKRIHLVISAPGNRSLMYWCLSKDRETREALISDIVKASQPFHGLQIDFETIRLEDRQAYWDFLKEIKKRLPKDKIFSVALPVRTKDLQDAFNYKQIEPIVDKILVMAYDEHYRTSAPGAIASTAWCEKVTDFAKSTIPSSKLIMGIPLYGRVWQKPEVACALKYFQTLELWKKHPTKVLRDPDGTPHFDYQQTVDASVYFEDIQSLNSKLSCYQSKGIQGIGFWRLGQGPAALWQSLKTTQK